MFLIKRESSIFTLVEAKTELEYWGWGLNTYVPVWREVRLQTREQVISFIDIRLKKNSLEPTFGDKLRRLPKMMTWWYGLVFNVARPMFKSACEQWDGSNTNTNNGVKDVNTHGNTNYFSLFHNIINRMLNTSKVIFSNHSMSCDGTWELTCHQLVDHTHGLLLAFHHCKPFEPIKGFWSIPHPPPPRTQTLLG